MGVIFFFSSLPDLNSGLGTIDAIGRKIIHTGEYALLCWLWWRPLRTVAPARTALALAVAVAVAYAATDELHQSFVPGRHGWAVDVAIDALGAGLAARAIRRREVRSAGGGVGARASRAA